MATEEYPDHWFAEYFVKLIGEFGMSEPRKEVYEMGWLYEARSENLILRLINHRGLIAFEVASVHRPNDFREVELIAESFREPNDRRPGVIRLSLAEQAEFIRSNWEALNEMLHRDNVRSL